MTAYSTAVTARRSRHRGIRRAGRGFPLRVGPASCAAARDGIGFNVRCSGIPLLTQHGYGCQIVSAPPCATRSLGLHHHSACPTPQLAAWACCTAPSCRGLADGLVTGALPAGSPPPLGSHGFNWQMAA
jgi:hypothetical protein